jgi:hypothetical protein
MIKLSPKAMRFIDRAARDLPADDRSVWERVDRDPSKALPDDAAKVALMALERFAGRLRDRLAAGGLDDDETADLSNDLGFVCAIESDLRKQITRSVPP